MSIGAYIKRLKRTPMHRYFSLLLMAGIAGMLWSCRAPFRNIEFGNFGGVTGGKYAYRVDANGKIWQGDQMIGRLPDNVRHSLKKEVAQFLKEPPTPFRYPANMNHFIQINTKDTILYYPYGHRQNIHTGL